MAANGQTSDSSTKAPHEPPSPALTTARLALLRQVQTVIRNGLTLLGISSPEKM
ncbi:MAG: DALR anticodon-binding domain-containing protein [Nitrospirales bacterium]